MTNEYDEVEFSDFDKQVIDSFERLFTFEFYIRYLKKNCRKDLNRIQRVKNIIREKFKRSDTVNKLSQCKIRFPNEPEVSYSLVIELHELVDWTLNALQQSNINLDSLNYYHIDDWDRRFSERAKNHLFAPFNELKKYITPFQKNLVYRFSDLTILNDINFVFNWWCSHADKVSRAKKGMIGKTGLLSIRNQQKEDGSYTNVLCYEPFPFHAPCVIRLRDCFRIHRSDHDVITINGKEITNSAVLSVRFDGELPNLDRIYKHFVNTLYDCQDSKYLNEVLTGNRPYIGLKKSAPSDISRYFFSNRYALLIDQQESIAKNLIGLMCYDEYNKSRKDKISISKAADNISLSIQKVLSRDADVIEKDYHHVLKRINNIDKVIEHKQNGMKLGETYDF